MPKVKFNIPKIDLDIPKYDFSECDVDIPEHPETTHVFPLLQHKPIHLNYEDSMFAEMADDIKSSYDQQLQTISIALNEQLAIAKVETAAAKKEAIISKIIAIVSLVVSVAIGIAQIFL